MFRNIRARISGAVALAAIVSPLKPAFTKLIAFEKELATRMGAGPFAYTAQWDAGA